MKLKKYQQGGVFNLPFAVYQPYNESQPVTEVNSPNKKTNNDIFTNEIYKLLGSLSDKALPGDFKAAQNTIINLINNIKQQLMFGEVPSLFGGTSSIEYQYLNALDSIIKMLFAKEEYKTAKTESIKNGSIKEYAIDSRGRVIVMSEDGFDWKTPEEIFLSNGKFTPITNAELLNYRAEGIGGLAFNSESLQTVSSAPSISSVTKLINDIIDKLGKDIESQNSYILLNAAQLMNGLQTLITAQEESELSDNSIINLYKNKILSESLAKQALYALNYIYNVLPNDAVSLLKMKSDGSEEGAKILINSLVTSKLSKTVKLTENNENKSKKSSGTIKNDPVKAFILGKGYKQPIKINIGNSYTFTVNGRYSLLTDKSGEALGANSTLEDVSGSAFAGILDMNSATFGGIKLNTNQGRKVLLDSADIIGMDLPIDQIAKSRGVIRPDLNLLQRLEKADTKIREENITDPEEINKIYVANNLPEKFKNENGTYKMNLLNYQRFARLSGVVEESALPQDVDLDETVQEITDSNFRNSIEEVLKSKDKDYNMSDGFLGTGVTDIFRGAIYVPVREDLIAASLGSGDYYELEGADATEVVEKWDQAQKIQSYVKAPSLGTLE